MGHLIFVVLHIIALVTGAVLLFLTIPAHLIYAAVASRKAPEPVVRPNEISELTHVRCADCRELVRADAVKCKHCGTKLVPQDLTPIIAAVDADRRNRTIAKAVVLVGVTVAVFVVWSFAARP